MDDLTDKQYKEKLDQITPLKKVIEKYQPDIKEEDRYFMMEFLLWGLVEYKKLSKHKLSEGFSFKDLYGSYINDL